jgi:hypothetical protein
MTTKEEILAEVKAVKEVEGIVAIVHSALMKSRIGLEVELGKLNKEASK